MGALTAQEAWGALASRDWYALGCTALLMLLGEYGGRKIKQGSREILLPADEVEIPEVLSRHVRAGNDSEELAARVISDLTAPIDRRATGNALRESEFLKATILALEEEIAAKQTESQKAESLRFPAFTGMLSI